MREGMPILFDMDEVERLNNIAYAAAIQTGAKGLELEEVHCEILRSLFAQANRSVEKAQAHPPLKLVED